MKKTFFVLALLVVLSSVSFGQLGLYAIGGGVGFVSVSNDIGSGFVVGAGVDLGSLTTNLHLRPDIGYWSVKKSVSGFNISFSDFSVNANVVYQITSAGKMTPFYLGGGLGLNSVSSEAVIPSFFGFGGGTVKATDSKFGINLLGGAGIPIAPKWFLHGEARYVLVSDFNHFALLAGIAYALK